MGVEQIQAASCENSFDGPCQRPASLLLFLSVSAACFLNSLPVLVVPYIMNLVVRVFCEPPGCVEEVRAGIPLVCVPTSTPIFRLLITGIPQVHGR